MYDINWNSIRPWKGSQSGGFQELCVQIARVKAPERARLIAPGTQDAGVECYCILPNGDEWGWQAKYFTSPLSQTQWQQLDKSVETALNKHPNLVRYYVCVPRDRSDPRVPGRRSEMDQWEAHVAKWEAWASKRGKEVEFIWWGSSELIDRLSRNEHVGCRLFWFGQQEFDEKWFRLRLDEVLKAAGPRYTSEIHVDLPIAQDLERFGRSDVLFNEVKSRARSIRRAHRSLMSVQRSTDAHAEELELDSLSGKASAVLDSLAQLEPSPAGYLPFPEIAQSADQACEEGMRVLERIWQLQREQRSRSDEVSTSPSYHQPLRNTLSYVERLQMALQEVVKVCNHAHSLANAQLLLLKGDGGTGKTHLLCDFTKRRIDAQLPTVLLAGQQFLSDEDPWAQLLRKLDLPGASSEEFVGALEAAAQASGCRALVIIDALNEGNGRRIWPTHLSSFLIRLEKSPWVAVALSVRTSYEQVVIPEDFRERAAVVTHHGFTGHEFDATRIFFAHYGLESPSTPILQPEFSNPLFLKAICKGLQGRGERRLPKGFHGITAVFDLYLKEIHERLWKPEALNYGPSRNLVRQALERLAARLAEHETRRLPHSEAQAIVDDLLPGRDYDASLYAALIAEGILTEDIDPRDGGLSEVVVSITYDRFADHVISDYLLNTHLDADDPAIAFSENGGLAFLDEKKQYVRHGLIEALCIQVPERTGKELVRLAPAVLNRPDIADAFLQSIMWRQNDAFSQDTLAALNELLQRENIWEDLLDTALSLATVPNHPFNAEFLDRILRRDAMPDRDSWWSTYLYTAWETQGPVDRLVDWASNVSASDDVEETVVDLAATTLAWMFTTPNRFLRDRATKALVALLTGRLESVERVVTRFADIDDPYASERVYAVAYGVAMRSYDADAVGKLALLVYERVFVSGSPPPHILLRDYARGVVERATHLGTSISIDVALVRPPYTSRWPDIPSEASVDALTPNQGNGAWATGDLEWSRNRIRHSVIGDFLNDFARYVIGTESEPSWLSLRLDEDRWQSPAERMEALLGEFTKTERAAYETFNSIENEPSPFLTVIQVSHSDGEQERQALSREIEQHDRRIEDSRKLLMSTLTEDHRSEMELILHAKSDSPPRFDVRAIQRYVLWRVFNLGWTIERFGHFDRFFIGDHGRSASKPERMGKKYQWIAYHEILAYLSDHYQYRERFLHDYGDRQYEGPWQLDVRDIDPSCALRFSPGGTSWGPHEPAWWGREQYDAWEEDVSHQNWLANRDGLPKIENLLEAVNPSDGTHWFNVDGSFAWRQPHSFDQEPYGDERRELWIGFTAYFVRAEEADSFLSWTKTVDFLGRWMPEPEKSFSLYFGEYGWSPADEYSRRRYSDAERWVRPVSPDGTGCPVAIQPVSFHYIAESGGFDCSVEDSFALRSPALEFIRHLGLVWSSKGADYVDTDGNLTAYDPTAHESGPSALLLRKESLELYLRDNNLSLCWVMLGEKLIVGGTTIGKYHGRSIMSGAFLLSQGKPVGFLDWDVDIP